MKSKSLSSLRKLNKRYQLLLEVLIAFALVVLCILPLIAPHVYIYQSQKRFVDKIELDHTVNLLYGQITELLYRNEIHLSDIENKKDFDVDQHLLEKIGYSKNFPFKGSYTFLEVKKKPLKVSSYHLYLYELTFTFEPNHSGSEKLTYNYKIFLAKILEHS